MTKESDIAAATSGFYESLNTLFTGEAEPMKKAWSHRDDCTYMGPDGLYLIGWKKIEEMWNNVAAMQLGGYVKPIQVNTVIGSDMAFITCMESGANEVEGIEENVSIRSSTVFRLEQGAWKAIAHQTDLLNFL